MSSTQKSKVSGEYFEGVSDASIKKALNRWRDENYDLAAFLKTIPSAGKPRSEFIDKDGYAPAPLKAVVKQAMLYSGIDPSEPQRSKFTTDNGKSFLEKKGYKFVRLEWNTQEGLTDFVRSRTYSLRPSRPKQAEFRNAVLARFNQRCAISGYTCVAALEAAHIHEVQDDGPDTEENGLLLRADLHLIFDAGILRVNPDDGTVHIADEATENYREFQGVQIKLPENSHDYSQFRRRWERT